MKLKIDTETDVLYLRLDESVIVESEEVQPGVILDFNAENRVVGVEFLGVSKRVTSEQLQSFCFETNLTSAGGPQTG